MSEEKKAFEGILVAAYADQGAADEVLKTVNEAKKEKTFQFWDAAVIRKDERGRYYFNETRDMSTPKGAGIGAIIGGLIGIPGGPAGIILGTGLGAALGGFAASADAGLKDDRLQDVGHALESGNSALLIISSHDYLRAMQEYAGEEDTTAAMHKLTKGISEHMVQGQNVAYSITAAGRSVSCHDLDAGGEIAKLLGVGTAEE
jgi:uncharacterized membrane protein